MARRMSGMLMCVVLALASVVGLGVPAGALAAGNITYDSCPASFAVFKSDVQYLTGTGSITFNDGAKNCTLTATGTIITALGSTITINGNGLTLSGGTSASPGAFDLFDVSAVASLTLNHTMLEYATNGINCTGSCSGVDLNDSTIRGNSENGIYFISSDTSALTVNNSSIKSNGNDGIYSVASTLHVKTSTISGNSAYAIEDEIGTIDLTGSDVSNNQSGGIFARDGNVTLNSSTIHDNTNGAGVNTSIVTATNTTISSNNHIGISADTATLTSSTVTGNKVAGVLAAAATMTATLLADNVGLSCAAPTTDKGYNLSDDSSCYFSATGSQNSVTDSDLNLGTLGDYGGPTETVPLLPQSVALNVIPVRSGACKKGESLDQRGVQRPQRKRCDVGAYELLVPTTTPANATAATTDTSTAFGATVATSCATSGTYCPVVDEGRVNFVVTDSTDTEVGNSVHGKVHNGSATANFVPTGLAPGTYTITAKYHDGSGLFGNSKDTSTLTITAGPANHIVLSPGDVTATVGTTETETATVTDQYGNPVVDGTEVDFNVTGVNPTSGSSTTVNGQASFSYSGTFTGLDTVTATAVDGSNPSATASITWTPPAATARASLTIMSPFRPQVQAFIVTNSSGGNPNGTLSYRDNSVSLSQVQLQSLVVSGNQATVYGTARLADGTPVSFILNATASSRSGTVRLRLSSGYDSGTEGVMSVRITSPSTHTVRRF